MASSSVGGLSGAFVPVSEDSGAVAAARDGALSLAKLEAMTAVCSVELDMVAVPGDTPAATIYGLVADEMAIGMVGNETTAVRIVPVPGKRPGDTVEWGGLLGTAIVQDPGRFSCTRLHARRGKGPAADHGVPELENLKRPDPRSSRAAAPLLREAPEHAKARGGERFRSGRSFTAGPGLRARSRFSGASPIAPHAGGVQWRSRRRSPPDPARGLPGRRRSR